MGRDLYQGSTAVKAKGDTYLIAGENESRTARTGATMSDYERRLRMAVLDPYIEKIINARQAIIFDKPHVRDLPPKLEAHEDDVDMKGTPASTFFAEAARDAQIDGIHWVGVDMPREPEGGFKSKLEQDQAGHRSFFYHIPGQCVIDWESDANGELLWAVIQLATQKPRLEWGTPVEVVPQWKVWTRTEWILYEASATEGAAPTQGKDGYKEISRGPHSAGVVPIVPFLGEPVTYYSGTPVAWRVFDYVLAIYNKQSGQDWFEWLAAHPIPFQIGPKQLEILNAAAGFFLKSMEGVETRVGYLEPTGAGFKSMRESINDYQARLYRIALAQAQRETSQVQSADAQREDRHMLTSSLRDDARSYEAAEQMCWEIKAAFEGEDGEINIEYHKDFDDKAIEAEMMEQLIALVHIGALTKKTLLTTVANSEIVKIPDIDKELKAAAEEGREAEAAAAVSMVKTLKAEAEAAAAVVASDDEP